MMMEMYSSKRLIFFTTILLCLQGICAECEVRDESLKIQSKVPGNDQYIIECKNNSLMMTVGQAQTYRMQKRNNEIFTCKDQSFVKQTMSRHVDITEVKCISKITCKRPTVDGVDITETKKQLRYVYEKDDVNRNIFAKYTAGDRIDLKCAYGYGQPISSCDEDPKAYDYDLDETIEKLPTEGTFTCTEDGTWSSEPAIDCKKIKCDWTGHRKIKNGTLVGLNSADLYFLDHAIKADCDEGFKPTEAAVCQSSGCFSTTTVSCIEILCPDLEKYSNFENGKIVYSNDRKIVNSAAKFICDPGYVLFGPYMRTCQGDGTWSDDECVTCQRLDYAKAPPTLKPSCPAPCVPFGAVKDGTNYEIGDTVLFHCHKDFDYLGNVDTIARVCLENTMWNGTDIQCTGTKMRAGKLLGNVMESIVARAEQTHKEWERNTSDVSQGRSIDIYNSLQLYLLVDTSVSINDDMFKIMKQFLNILVEKVFSAKKDKNTGTEVFLRYFGTNVTMPIGFTSLTQFLAHNITRAEVKDRTGSDTNIPKALKDTSNIIGTRRAVDDKKGYTPSRVLIIISDGQNNMGGQPSMDDIRELHSLVETYSIFMGKKDSEMDSPIEKLGYHLMKTLASPKDNKIQDEHFIRIELNKSEDSLMRIVSEMTNVSADPIQCGEYSDKTQLNINQDVETMKDAQEGAWPWMVQLVNRQGIHQCGGTILNENWILTAAHCEIKGDWDIYIGRASEADHGSAFIKTSMASSFSHEKYDATTFQYDLRVVKVTNPIIFKREKPFAAPVCLYNATEFPNIIYGNLFAPESRGVVTGWEAKINKGLASETLKQMQISIHHNTICEAKENTTKKNIFNSSVEFCATGKGQGNKTIDACKGYSGSPFVVRVERMDSNNKRKFAFIQIGIVSHGVGCGSHWYYVRLTPDMIEWIRNKIVF